MVKVVEKEEFAAWVDQAKVEFASYDGANTNLAEVSATQLSK
jgi:heme/copper-type cytochrome/quinol oxidase subunit 2